jgi:hypothetical protein
MLPLKRTQVVSRAGLPLAAAARMATSHQLSGVMIGAWALLVAGGPDGVASPTMGAPPIPPPQLANGLAPIPANGALLIARGRGASPSGAVTITINDDQGHALSGVSRDEDGYVVWTPSEPFVVGKTYTAVLLGADNLQTSTTDITIAPARAVTRPALTSALSLRRIDVTVERTCCTTLSGFPTPVVPSNCAATQIAGHAGLTATLTSSASASELHQFLFRVTGVDSSDMAVYRAELSVPELNFPKQADQYCIRVEAMELASGMVFAYDDLMPVCAARGPLGDLSSMPVTFDPYPLLNHVNCQVPPAGYEAMWCDVNGWMCSSDRPQQGCEDYGHLCQGEAEPVPPDAIGGSGGSVAMSTAAADAGSPGAAGALTNSDAMPHGQGCAVTAPGAKGRALPALWLALSVAWCRFVFRNIRRARRAG